MPLAVFTGRGISRTSLQVSILSYHAAIAVEIGVCMTIGSKRSSRNDQMGTLSNGEVADVGLQDPTRETLFVYFYGCSRYDILV